jgi:cell division protein FtsA
MNYFSINPIYTILDIGTTKIFVIIAEKKQDQLQILSIGEAPSYGLEKGVVKDVKLTAECIKEAIKEAQSRAHIFVESVSVGISGSHIKSYFSQGMSSIGHGGITEKIIHEATMAAQSISLPDDEKIIHAVPIDYMIDGIHHIKNPLNMHGFRLEVTTHIMTANKHAIANITEACKQAQLKITELVLEPIASAEAVLNKEEQEIGTLLVDIGGGTSDIALYKNGTLEYVHILNIAGTTFTKDLSICLNIGKEQAELVKKKYGIEFDKEEEVITATALDGITELYFDKNLPQQILAARAEELIFYLSEIIHNHKDKYAIPGGIVLTGGGSLLKGLSEMVSRYTGIRCRVGIPHIHQEQTYEAMKHPYFATAYGLLLYKIKQDKRFQEEEKQHTFIQKFKHFVNKFI